MTDEELLLWLRVEDTNLTDFAAARIEELSKERDQHWDSFVHWRKEADDRSEQLAAARQDAEEAEAYAEELEKERDALEAKLAKAVEAVDKAAALIEERHVVYMTAKGRNPKDYISEWSLIAKEVRATLAEINGESHE